MISVNKQSLLNTNRKLQFTPVHFTKTNIPLSEKVIVWVYENTNSRFSTYTKSKDGDEFDMLFTSNECVAFEDPKEALLCELKWS